VIDNQHALAEFLPQISAEGIIGLDTEADSLHAYPEKLCLIQVGLEQSQALVDPLAAFDLAPLLDLLRTKELVFHGADYDLRLLHRTFQFVPRTVFDTMWAARLLGYAEFGLRDLVRQHLGVELEKGPQKMNWGMRPLPDRMAIYALNDTRYLRPLADLLRTRLKEQGRLAWQNEICARVIEECSQPRAYDPGSLWRIKGSDRLDPPAMAMLRALWQWRESEAITANKPPFFILSHELLVAVAAAAAHGKPAGHLLPRHVSAKRVARLANAIEQGLKVAPSEYPQRRTSSAQRLNRAQQTRFDQLKRVRDTRAGELGIDPTLIASKGDLASLARDKKSNQLMAWQLRLLEAN
jgi:ribonuclease D